MANSPKLHTIDPTDPPAPWQGGKRNLAKRLTQMIGEVPHTTYCEPFVGMGGIFFRRKLRPKAEVINDISRDITNLFRILQRHYPQFLEVLRFGLTTRVEFERLAKTNPDTLTDLERAARFLYLQRTTFGGKVRGKTFGVSVERPARFNLTTLDPMLEDIHSRLSGVVIECLSFDAFIDRYDRPETLFYLDPPYWGCEDDYGKNIFEADDFARIAEQLAGIKGRFILSINDAPEIREIFAGFDIAEVETTYGLATKAGTAKGRRELVVSSAS